MTSHMLKQSDNFKNFEEWFFVKHVVNNNSLVYKLQDQAGEDMKGMLYAKELQKVTEPDSCLIEKAI